MGSCTKVHIDQLWVLWPKPTKHMYKRVNFVKCYSGLIQYIFCWSRSFVLVSKYCKIYCFWTNFSSIEGKLQINVYKYIQDRCLPPSPEVQVLLNIFTSPYIYNIGAATERKGPTYLPTTKSWYRICSTTPYQKSDLSITRNETARFVVSNSYIHVSVSNLYIHRVGLPIWLQQNRQTDSGNIQYKSLTDTWMWRLGGRTL